MGAGGFAWSTPAIDEENKKIAAEKEKAGEKVYLLWSPWDADQAGFQGIPLSYDELQEVASKRIARKGTEEIYAEWGVDDLIDAKPFSLPQLDFGVDTLAPYLSKDNVEYQYSKHHANYVRTLNELAKETPAIASKSLEELVKTADGAVFNNAAQVWNHNFYWKSITSKIYNGGGLPRGAIAEKIQEDFGGFDALKTKFNEVAANHFGSGWAWVVLKDGKLDVVGTHDASNPVKENLGTPILCVSVWEHAYYIDYRNARPAFLDAFWNLVNWDFANANLEAAMPKKEEAAATTA